MPPLTRQIFSRVLDSWRFRERVEQLMRARLANARFSAPRDLPLAPLPYARPHATRPPGALRGSGAIFITARFRTGSTLLWQLFNALPGFMAFYEPLNERHARPDTWTGTDPSHRGATDYRLHYERVEPLQHAAAEGWTYDNLYMDEGDFDPALEAWITRLLGPHGAVPVLQFNRVDFRLRWLRAHFPGAYLLHLYRHPRAQWMSMVGGRPIGPTTTLAEFERHDGFYLLPWARDLAHVYPFLRPERHASPYALHYLLWRLSYAHGRRHADRSVGFEALCADVAGTLDEVLQQAGHAAPADALARLQALIDPPAAEGWTEFAPPAWFDAIEDACDRQLAIAFGSSTRETPGG